MLSKRNNSKMLSVFLFQKCPALGVRGSLLTALALNVGNFVLDFLLGNIGTWSCCANCSVLVQASDPLLGLSSLHVHEGVEVRQRSVDRDGSASHFSPVFDGGRKDVPILLLEQVSDSCCGELMFVARFVPEQDNNTDVGCLALFFPNHKEVASREFLSPERTK